MRLSDRLGKAQRIVVVIAFGLALGAVGSYLVNLGNTLRAGWYAGVYDLATFGGDQSVDNAVRTGFRASRSVDSSGLYARFRLWVCAGWLGLAGARCCNRLR